MTYNEFIEKYGDKRVKFRSYYKFDFCFNAEGEEFYVMVGSTADDIYRLSVDAKSDYSVYELEPYAANINGQFFYF